MSLEIVGMIATQEASEIMPAQGPLIDLEFTARFARAHEDSGFDRVLIGYGTYWADGWQVANHVARATERIKLLLAHRPGFVAPSLTARQAVSFDHLAGGGDWRCTSSPVVTKPISAAMAISSITIVATVAPPSTSRSSVTSCSTLTHLISRASSIGSKAPAFPFGPPPKPVSPSTSVAPQRPRSKSVPATPTCTCCGANPSHQRRCG
jgi:Luciferase-like monooxygenase